MQLEPLSDVKLTTKFVTIMIDHPPSIEGLVQIIVESLRPFGDPLRWAITTVDPIEQKLHVEAVVITSVPRNEQ